MATSKVLQKAQILSIIGSTLRIAHPDISSYPLTYLNTPSEAGDTSFSVYDNNRFADNDWLILGDPGDEETEEVDVNGSVTRGQAITLTNTTKFDHETDTPFRKILERGIRIYGAATDGGSGTLIESIDAISSPIENATLIDWTKQYTEYTLISTDTAYAYYFVKFTDGTTDGAASDYIAAGGADSGVLDNLIESALELTNTVIDTNGITREFLVRQADRCQDAITQLAIQKPNGRRVKKNWSFELTSDTITSVVNENVYALSGLDPTIKDPNTPDSILNVRFGDNPPLEQLNIQDMRDRLAQYPNTTVATSITAADTSVVLTDTSDFADAGSFYIKGQDEAVTYTGNNKDTNTLSGIPSSGSGSISSTTALAGTQVWQTLEPGLPKYYAVYVGNLILDRPVGSDYVSQKLKMDYFKKLTRISESSDVTQVTFYNIFELYLCAKIEERKQNKQSATDYMNQFTNLLLQNAASDKIPNKDVTSRYTFANPTTFG